jgi:hypothetical protein
MLSVAQKKALEAGTEVLFLNQDISGFELYGTADARLILRLIYKPNKCEPQASKSPTHI